MFLDKELCFCEKQAITASAVSQNVIYAGEDCGAGTPLRFKIFVEEEDFATLTSLLVKVQASDVADFSTYRNILETDAISASKLVQGYTYALPPLPAKHDGFLRLSFVVSGTDATAGKISGYLIMDDQTNV